MSGPDIEEQKRDFKAKLKEVEGVFTKVKAKWKKEREEKGISQAMYMGDEVAQAASDVAFWDYMVWKVSKW